MRTYALALALLAAAPAAAKPGAAAPVAEAPFPQPTDRFLLFVRGPDVPGRARFARIYAAPAGRGAWTTTVVCGTVDTKTGRERLELQAGGEAWLDGGALGGSWSPPGNRYGEAQMRTWSVDTRDGLDVMVSMSGPCPSRGNGDLSTGD